MSTQQNNSDHLSGGKLESAVAILPKVGVSDDFLRRCLVEIDHLIHCTNTDEAPFAGDETHQIRADIIEARAQLKRRPNPAHGAPRPPGHNPVA